MMNESGNLLYAKRIKIQNRWVSGFFQNIRIFTIWIALSIFLIAPWLRWHGHQAILFALEERKLHIFNMTFWPPDAFLFLLLVICGALSLFIVTQMAGRIWCGYTCPQTVWTRIFMWIEYLTEGDRNKRLKRDKNPFEYSTIIRRIAKHALWLTVSLITAITFVGFFVPITRLILHIFTFHASALEIFWIGFFTLATYMNAGWMREQVCLHICPYARFQSVMFDSNTLVITYDQKRGEPRGARKHGDNAQNNSLGDCIDCQVCVQVCPTGIDIRKGLQMACIGCAACVDACDDVMDKMKYPSGLIRYATENSIAGKKTQILKPRLIASVFLLLVIFSIFLYLFSTRIPIQFSILHEHQNLYRISSKGLVQNNYEINVTNMTEKKQHYRISYAGLSDLELVGTTEITLNPEENRTLAVTLITTEKTPYATKTPITFTIENLENPNHRVTRISNFFNKH